MKKLRIELVKSGIDRPARQKRTLIALGLTKMHRVRVVDASSPVVGMIDSVKHLLSIEEV